MNFSPASQLPSAMPSKLVRTVLTFLGCIIAPALHRTEAAESILRPGDVVAIIGGEDMVTAAEYGYLEYLVVRANPKSQFKFRSIAKEGDTAFEHARDFNYPTLERQLDDVGASVVIIQLGQMESLRGATDIPQFEIEVNKLVERAAAGGKRRVILVGPTPVSRNSPAAGRFTAIAAYSDAVRRIAGRKELPCILPSESNAFAPEDYRDGLHLNERGQYKLAKQITAALAPARSVDQPVNRDERQLLEMIRTKNQLWFNYARPQNWAFLDGDRTVQPASRDHRNPEKRWFPEEMKAWLPLIAAREAEIWALGRQLESK
jgi:hypothetical protein